MRNQMEIDKGMSLMVECEDCCEKFELSSTNSSVVHKRKYDVNGQSIFLSYYDCPKCGRRHFVQIDNQATLNELREVERLFVKLAVAKKKGKQPPQSQSAKFKRTREHLGDSRKQLMNQYTGKLLHDSETDSDFTLKFSV